MSHEVVTRTPKARSADRVALDSEGVRRAFVFVLVMLAAFLGLFRLGAKSFWLDEGFSFWFAGLPWRQLLVAVTRVDASMPLYITLLHPWLNFGDSEFAIRSLSVIFAVGAVPLLYLVGTELFGPREGLLAASLLTINEFFVQYAQQARGYSLVMTLVILSTYLFLRAVKQPTLGNWIAYAVGTTAAVFAQAFALLVIIVHGISLVFVRPKSRFLRPAVAIYGCLGLLILPMMVTLASAQGSGRFSWIPQPSVAEFVKLLVSLAGGAPLLGCYGILGLLALIWAARAWSAKEDPLARWRVALAIGWVLLPLLLAVAASLFIPLLLPRYFIVVLPALALTGAVGLATIGHRPARYAAFVIVVALSAISLWGWYNRGSIEGWRTAARFVTSKANPGDGLVFQVASGAAPFGYYLERMNSTDRAPRFLYPRWNLESHRFRRADLEPVIHLLVSRNSYSRVWLVLSHNTGTEEAIDRRALIRRSLLRHYTNSYSRRFKGIDLELYERRP